MCSQQTSGLQCFSLRVGNKKKIKNKGGGGQGIKNVCYSPAHYLKSVGSV